MQDAEMFAWLLKCQLSFCRQVVSRQFSVVSMYVAPFLTTDN